MPSQAGSRARGSTVSDPDDSCVPVSGAARGQLDGAVPDEFRGVGGTFGGINTCDAFSEWAHLYYVTLGNRSPCTPGDSVCSTPQAGWGFVNAGPFTNAQAYGFWSGTEYALDPNAAWGFATGGGNQFFADKFTELLAVAVRPGDVAAVPEPRTLALLVLGLGGVMVAARRRPS